MQLPIPADCCQICCTCIIMMHAGYNPESDQVHRMVTESQYGSWTKLSLQDSTVATHSDTAQEQEGRQTQEMGVTTCSQFLTQPPSEQQDSILREWPPCTVGPPPHECSKLHILQLFPVHSWDMKVLWICIFPSLHGAGYQIPYCHYY